MNRLTAASLLYEADLGKRILVLSENVLMADYAFSEVNDIGRHLGLVQRSWSSTEFRLQTTRGEIAFLTIGNYRALEGRRADLIYVEPISDRRALEGTYHEVLHGMQVRGAELVIE